MHEFVKVLLKSGEVVQGMGAIINGTWIIDSTDGPMDVYGKVAAEWIGDGWIKYA